MLLERFYVPGLAQVAYGVADEQAGVAAIVDPRRDVDEYLTWAEDNSLNIIAALETHIHADFVSGARELRKATGCEIYAGALGAPEFEHTPLKNGDEVTVGDLRLVARHTPGHTPEHVAFLLYTPDGGGTPTTLYSGDLLFVGDVGRPDLLGASATRILAQQLFGSVEGVLKQLPDELEVMPGHTAGSACGKKIGDDPSTTIGREKKENYAFQFSDQEAFVSAVLDDMPPPPAYYPVLKRINKAGAPFLETLDDPRAMSGEDVASAREKGALLIDLRAPDAFAEKHIAGSFFCGWGPNFYAWLGWKAPFERDIVFVADSEDDIRSATTAARQIGIDRVIGYLDGGINAWTGETASYDQTDVDGLEDKLQDGITVLDVRNESEWNDGHIEGATHRFVGDIIAGLLPDAVADPDQKLAVICGSGYRSSVACSELIRKGYSKLINVQGGMSAWKDAGKPTKKEE